MWLIFSIFIVFVVLQAFTPFITNKTAVFGVFIPEPYINHDRLHRYKKQYSIIVLIIGLILIVLQQLLFNGAGETVVVYVTLCMMFVSMITSACSYLLFRSKILQLKQQEAWTAHVETKHVTDLSLRNEPFVLPSVFFIVPMVVTAALIVITYINYASIPSQVPIHWNVKGEADDWVAKSALTVILSPLLLLCLQITFFAMNRGIEKARIRLSVQHTKDSIVREKKYRKGSSFYFAITSYSLTILLVTMHYTSIILIDESPSYFNWLFISVLVVTVGGALAMAYLQFKVKEPLTVTSNETLPDDDRYWKLGIFYVNRQDPSFIVQKRFGVGWTVNFANKWAYSILLIIFIPLILFWITD